MIVNYKIKLETIDEIKKFVNSVQKFESDIDLVSERYVVNSKSIIGIFSLDLSRPVGVVIHEEQGIDEIDKINEAMEEFKVDAL